jgi:hypothetical protein
MKIVKLDIDENSILEGIDAMALVEAPAIEETFYYFASEKFADTYNDYPEGVVEAAKQGIKRNEAIGNRCATQVGKVRAQQLANREAISLDTVKRMRSFLIRQKDNYELARDRKDYNACGYISYLLWGGPSALPWAEKILRQAGETFVKDEFEGLEDACQPGYVAYGLKRKNGRLVPNCVPKQNFNNALIEYIIFSEFTKFAGDKISFDYHDTLNTPRGEELASQLIDEGFDVYVISAAQSVNELYSLTDELGIPRSKVFATGSNKAKIEKIKELGITKHYDNNSDVISELGTIGAQFELEVASLPDYSNEPTGSIEISEASYGFSAVQDQQILVGPAMVPNKLIVRKDENGDPYYVYFTEDAIKKIAYKMMADKVIDKVNIEHDGEQIVDGAYLVESWIVEDPNKDKSLAYGFTPKKGEWFTMYKIQDKSIWDNYIKTGKVKGFSVEGYFSEKMMASAITKEVHPRSQWLKNKNK